MSYRKDATIVSNRIVEPVRKPREEGCIYRPDDEGQVWCLTHGYLIDCPNSGFFISVHAYEAGE